MLKNQNKTSTFEHYRIHMKKMLTLWISNGLTSVYALWRLNHTDLIPVCDSYVDTINGVANQEQALHAYKKVK